MPEKLTPVQMRMLRYFASMPGGEYPQSKAVETRTLEALTRGGYIRLIHPHGVEITEKGHDALAGVTENPWTPPGAFWPRYELKIMPAESYMHGGKRIIHKWRVVKWTFDPDSPRPIEEEVGFACNFGDAEQVAFKYARMQHTKDPRNPNDIRVFNDQGRCIWSLQGLC